ncbi:MAG: HPr family phosphocarrier protein [Spirochaetaceae bacterium]|nr:MAG: HPr family phosphocarrier protein [Spirochaetaceae bacterium]
MKEKTVTVLNKAGIHARPAALLVKTAGGFKSSIYLEKNSERVNGKSIMGVITLGAVCNTKINIVAEGSDEAEAVEAIARLFENKFEED